jgi:hypothetical protein
MEFRAAEIEAVAQLVPEAEKIVKVLKSGKTNSPKDAYFYLAGLPPEMLAFVEVELPNPKALSKIRAYVQKWRPLRMAMPVAELDALGVPRGPKFDKVLEQLFEIQLRGRGRTPEERVPILRKLAGIKEEPKKKLEKEKKRKGKELVGAKPEKPKPAAAAPPATPPVVPQVKVIPPAVQTGIRAPQPAIKPAPPAAQSTKRPRSRPGAKPAKPRSAKKSRR